MSNTTDAQNMRQSPAMMQQKMSKRLPWLASRDSSFTRESSPTERGRSKVESQSIPMLSIDSSITIKSIPERVESTRLPKDGESTEISSKEKTAYIHNPPNCCYHSPVMGAFGHKYHPPTPRTLSGSRFSDLKMSAPESRLPVPVGRLDGSELYRSPTSVKHTGFTPMSKTIEKTVPTEDQLSRVPSTGTPQRISQGQIIPTQPIPGRNVSYTVEDLETMVHEAVGVAGNTANNEQVENIYEIIEEARNAVQDAIGSRHDSIAVDFAYMHRSHSTPSQSSSDGDIITSHSPLSTRSNLLLPPQSARSTTRDHVDFILRPLGRSTTRGRSEQRGPDESAVRYRPHRGHRYVSSSSGDASRPSSHSSQERLVQAKAYGNTLRVREQIHAHKFSFHRRHHKDMIARNWPTTKKRFTAVIACVNTALLGLIIGVYAGEVPRIQYILADERHHIVILGNAVLFFGLAISTFFTWSLPTLHGRKPYVLAALAIALPLQFPQAIVVGTRRSPTDVRYRTGLLCARAASGAILGLANVNFFTVLLDLFGASLQSRSPHGEVVDPNNLRRHGGGMGIWLGVWSWSWTGSIAIGFQIGAAIIERLNPDWGFYVVVILLAAVLILNIICPEPRYAPYRKSITEIYDHDENFIVRRVLRGEVKLHISTEGPKHWYEEVWAGIKLMTMMICQPGFFVLSVYVGWIYSQVVLIITLLGALLSRDYKWQPRYVGAGVMSIAIGGAFAIPLTKAGIFSRERKKAYRTDSMTFQKQVSWSSHLVRRAVFMIALPLMGIAYSISSAGKPKIFMVPILFAGAVGFLSVLAVAKCYGLIMETFDTCDLQPGSNTRHRIESMAVQDRRRRTKYTSFPRVAAGIFASQSLGFIGAAVATTVGGSMTRRLGAQASTGVFAGILFVLSILLTLVLWRFKQVQVIPTHTFGTRRNTRGWQEVKQLERAGRGPDWKAVVIGNPSGKMRKMNMLELGALSRWTEIRKLNFLLKGPVLGQDTRKRRYFRDG